jgi:hypothetical protein
VPPGTSGEDQIGPIGVAVAHLPGERAHRVFGEFGPFADPLSQ